MRVRTRHGLRTDLPGAPEQRIDDAPVVREVARIADESFARDAHATVREGDVVRAGQPLLASRAFPELRLAAPVGGTVVSVRRGGGRNGLAVSVRVDETVEPLGFERSAFGDLPSLDAAAARSRLQQAGLWAGFRARPFDRVPRPADSADAILVRAIDTNPLAPDPRVLIADRPEAFAAGIRVLGALADTVYVCQAPGPALSSHPLPPGVRVVDIDGPHPAGLPGTLVAHLAPVAHGRSTWHIDAQDVIAIGELFTSGRYPARRVVALGGPGALRPRLLGTVAGAAIDSLLDREIRPDARVVLGSILAGRETEPGAAFLGRYDTQITALDPDAGFPRDRRARRSPGLLERVIGRADVMLPLERFERLWPLPFPLLPLLRAVLVGDCEAAARLGCLNLAEEDMALCEYACPGRQAYGAALRAVLDELEPDADESP